MRSFAMIPVFAVALWVPSAAHSSTYVVAPDGTGDFPTIQQAIDAVVDGDIIELADGTFAGAGNRDIDFAGKAITIRSLNGDPYSCVIDCQATSADQHRAFIFSSGEGGDSSVNGVMVKNGFHIHGCGIFCDSGVTPTIEDCVFADCAPEPAPNTFGGGIYCGGGAGPTVVNCLFTGCEALHGAGMYCANASPSVTGCLFVGGHGYWGSGIYCDEACSPVLDGCIIANNYGYGLTGFTCNASCTPVLRNCTIYGNSREAYGGGISSIAGSNVLTVENCLIAFNEGPSVYFMMGISGFSISCSDFYGNGGDWFWPIDEQYGINGNFSACPLLCDPANNDFQLQDCSPCAPGNHPDGYDCGLIGAYGVGCECGPPSLAHGATWSQLKSEFK